MDNRWYNGRQETNSQDARQQEREEAYRSSLVEDLGEDFCLPIDHRPTENLELDNLERASLDTQLTSSNVGFRLLQKMGWKGKGLGKDEQGIVEPIRAGIRDPKLGVGKQEQDDFFTAEENVQRKKLDVELEETEEHAKKREVIAEREQKIQTEVKEIRKVFFCDLCNKQYKLAMEFEVHLSSYDHNHRKRFKEMKEMHGGSSRDDRQKREQLRQEREMAKFAQIADARKQKQQQQQQQQQKQQQEQSVESPASSTLRSATAVQEQRQTLKFGFSSKAGASKDINGRLLTVNKAAPRGSRVERAPREFEPAFRIYVGNLPWQVDNARLEQLFSEHGKVMEARVVYDRETGRSRGFGFVTMSTRDELDDAVAALDGQSLDGRAIRVNMAEERSRRAF